MQTTPLKQAREDRGESCRFVALAVEVDQSQLSRIENGKAYPSRDLAKRLANYFAPALTRDQILFPEDYVTPSTRKPVRSSNLQEAR